MKIKIFIVWYYELCVLNYILFIMGGIEWFGIIRSFIYLYLMFIFWKFGYLYKVNLIFNE